MEDGALWFRLLSLSGVIQKQEFPTERVGAHLRQIAPSLLGAAVHGFAETLPLSIGVSSGSTGHGGGGHSGQLIVPGLVALSISFGIHGVHLGEETVGVIRQMIWVGQDLLHRGATGGHIFQHTVLLNQSVFKHGGILIQNAGSFDTEVINDGGGFRA